MLKNKFRKIKNIKMKILSIVVLASMMAVQIEPLSGLFAAAGSLNFNPGGHINPVYDSNYQYSTGIYDATLGGASAYCMDYGRLSPSGVLSFKNKLSPQSTAVLVYGYPNSSPASMGLSSNSEAHTATQLALWEITQATGENVNSILTFDYSTLSANAGYESHVANAIAAAKRLAAKARGGYSANPTINITGNGAKLSHTGNQIVAGPYQVNVSQANASSVNVSLSGAPASAMTTDASGNQKSTFAVNENIFVRLSDAERTGSLTLNASADGDKIVGCKYGDNDPEVQDYGMLSREPITLKTNIGVNWNGLDGNVQLLKVDQNNNKIPGVVFELKDSKGSVVAKETSGADGMVKFSNIAVGTYTLTEISAPAGYTMSKDPINVVVKAGETTKVTCVNQKINGTLKIIKTGEDGKALSGVTFNILNEDKRPIGKITTGADGIATKNDLPKGTYYYQEVSAPDYVVMDTNIYEFKLDGNTITKEITNKFVNGTLKIVKTDSDKTPLANVKFQILDSSKKVIETITTGADGIATSKALLKGTYYYKEIEAPDNVMMDKKEYEFKISTQNEVVTKNIVNKLVKGSLKIIKVDENDKPLAGVKFNIYNEKGKKVDTITTNDSGIAVSKELQKGKYTYQEVSAPEGVIIDTTKYDFIVEKDNDLVIKNIVNKLVRGKLEILKVDDNKQPIEGVKFDILNDQKQVVDNIVTNKEGIATTKELTYGTYYYKEVAAPDNVVMDTKEHEFKIKEDKKVITKTVVNTKLVGELKITKLDKQSKEPIAGVSFEILNEEKQVIGTIITDENGIAKIGNLLKGKYFYKEVKAPDKYIMDNKEYEFNIVKNNQLIEKTVYNEAKKLPVTGGFFGTDFTIIATVAIMSALGYIVLNVISTKRKILDGENDLIV
ncbi:MAG: SpaA isopeptide-forming pilin-related protein [Clostridia bacterium]